MNSELINVAIIGKDAEEFLSSEIGRYMLECAANQVDDAVCKLKKANPLDTELIITLQNEIYRAESFGAWISDLVIAGNQAIQQIDGDAQND